jgi:hypothetical protein
MRSAVIAAAGAAVLVAAGCGSATPRRPGGAAVVVPAAPLDTSLVTAAGTWATVVMGGAAAAHNNFWQLFIYPAGATGWKLVTPPGTADNGGLVVAGGAGQSAIAAFRPSQFLTYTPLTQTNNSGTGWSGLDPLDSAIASTPSSLAVRPVDGQLLVLTGGGKAEQAGSSATGWTTVTTERTLAASPAARRCGLRALTAVAYSPSGAPMLAGQCAQPGTAGLFADMNGRWQGAGLSLPASLAAQDITVLRLAVQGSVIGALLQAGSGAGASLLAAWSATGIGSWTTSAPFPLGSGRVASASFGPAGTVAITTTTGTGAVITGTAGPWDTLPALPPGTATLALVGGVTDVLTVDGGTLTVWRLPADGAHWSRAQVIIVPIQYGSSS